MSTKMECYDCSGHGYQIEIFERGREENIKCDTCNGTGYNLPAVRTRGTAEDEIRHHAHMHGCKAPEEYDD